MEFGRGIKGPSKMDQMENITASNIFVLETKSFCIHFEQNIA